MSTRHSILLRVDTNHSICRFNYHLTSIRILATFAILCFFLSAKATPEWKKPALDSLEQALSHQVDPTERIHTLINLSDILPPQKSPKYTLMLLDESRKNKSTEGLVVALPKLGWWKMWETRGNEPNEYVEYIANELPESLGLPLSALIEMVGNTLSVLDDDDSSCNEMVSATLKNLENLEHQNVDIYTKLKYINILIACNDRLYSLKPVKAKYYQREMLKYELKFYELVKNMPQGYGSDALKQHILSLLVANPVLSTDKKDEFAKMRLEYIRSFYDQPAIKSRPWYPKIVEVAVYSEMLRVPTLSDEDKHYYLERCLELINDDRSNTVIRPVEYARARYTTFFFENKTAPLTKKEKAQYREALEICIKLGPMSDAITDYIHLATVYYDDGKYKDAANTLMKMTFMADSIHTADNEELALRLQNQYEVAVHELENANLRAANQRNIIIAALLFLIILSCWGIYNKKVSTKMKRLNKRILESEDMKTAFIQSMCHEIRTPLNIISGNAQVIAMGRANTHVKHQMLEEIERQTTELTTAVDSLLNISMLNTSEHALPTAPTILQPEFEKKINKYREIAPHYVWNLEMGEVPCVLTNSQYLMRVIETLLSNVVKHCPEGTTANVKVDYDNKSQKLKIVVEDNGPGIPVDRYPMIFDRFYKINEFVQGIGIGLHFSKLAMEHLNGNIKPDATYQNGLRMILTLDAKLANINQSNSEEAEQKAVQ